MKNKRVLVTGGAGFIVSNLAEELSKENDVVILDDLSMGRKNAVLCRYHFAPAPTHGSFRLLQDIK